MTATVETELVLLGDIGYDDDLRKSAADAIKSLHSRVPDLTLPRRITWRTFTGPADRDRLEVAMTDDPRLPAEAVMRLFSKDMMARPDVRDVYHLQVFGDLLAQRTLKQRQVVDKMLMELVEEEDNGQSC